MLQFQKIPKSLKKKVVEDILVSARLASSLQHVWGILGLTRAGRGATCGQLVALGAACGRHGWALGGQ